MINTTAVKVSNALLKDPPPQVKCPTYDRSALRTGIVHLGFGNFHRAHQALYADQLMELHGMRDWGICGVGTTPQDARMHAAMKSQDNLYTLVERGPKGNSARIIGSVTGYIFGHQDPEAAFQKMADPAIKIVSMTTTESSYYMHSGTGELMLDHPAVKNDLHNPTKPQTIFGYLAEGLERRMKAAMKPFTVLSCDNVQGNGKVARKMLLTFCQERSPALAQWVEKNVTTPSCMVDRITPATTEEMETYVKETFGVHDLYPVITEPFLQWVIEDEFCNGRPEWEKVGVQITHDVEPWEKTKMSILNALHSAMGYTGYLCGFRFIHEIAHAPAFIPYLTDMLDIEVTPLMPPIPGLDLTAYKRSAMERFGNPMLQDTCLRICMDGSAKLPKFILPSIIGELQRNGPIRRLTLCVAAWIRFLNGVDEQGVVIPIVDPMGEKLQALAKKHRENPRPFLELTDIFSDLGKSERFVQELELLLKMLYEKGAAETLKFASKG